MKIGLFGIVAVFLATLLKKERAEFSLLISLAACALIFLYVLAQVQAVVVFFEGLWKKLPAEQGFLVQILKILGISYAADFASGICRDAGHQAIGGQIELFARISVLVLCIPGITYLIAVLEEFL